MEVKMEKEYKVNVSIKDNNTNGIVEYIFDDEKKADKFLEIIKTTKTKNVIMAARIRS